MAVAAAALVVFALDAVSDDDAVKAPPSITVEAGEAFPNGDRFTVKAHQEDIPPGDPRYVPPPSRASGARRTCEAGLEIRIVLPSLS